MRHSRLIKIIIFLNNDFFSVKMKCLQEREEQIKILHEKITEIQKCTQEQLDEKSSQLDEIIEKLERHNERKEKLKQQLKVKELELEEIRKAYRYFTNFLLRNYVWLNNFI